jgi:NAD(P)H-dependent flavin oxidoreductase YrpB (nitropropane dioxygenase family)
MLTTRFTRLIGCTVPIQHAGMGTTSPPELAAAVAEAGVLGMLRTARAGLNPATFAVLLERTRKLTTHPVGLNFIMRAGSVAARSPREFIEQAATAARVVEFFYTDPSTEFVRIVHDHGAVASWQVGSRDEALAAVDAGCDLIVAQGIGAGGHVRGTVGLLDLLCEVLDAVRDVPVLAASGIGNGRAMGAALAAGADGVRVGTRFVATDEAGVYRVYAEALISARAEDSVYTQTFHVGWPEAPHRALRSAIAVATAFPGDVVATVTGLDGVQLSVQRFGTRVPDRTATGEVRPMSLYAGESVGSVKRVLPAREVVHELADEAEQFLRRPR